MGLRYGTTSHHHFLVKLTRVFLTVYMQLLESVHNDVRFSGHINLNNSFRTIVG